MRQRLFGQNGFTIIQDTGSSADTRGAAFLLNLFLGMDYAANAFQPTMGVLHSRSSTEQMIRGNENWWRYSVIVFKMYRMAL
jgi:hypothetical protein